MDESRLQEMWDHHEIRQLLATYCHGCDRADELEMASVYAEDSWDDHGERKCDGKTFSHLVVTESDGTYKMMSHQLGQSLIEVDGDQAGAETYFIATVIFAKNPEEDEIHHMGGRYVDTLVREHGAWKVKERLCVREWSYSQAIPDDWLPKGTFIESKRGPADVSWKVLGRSHSGVPETVAG